MYKSFVVHHNCLSVSELLSVFQYYTRISYLLVIADHPKIKCKMTGIYSFTVSVDQESKSSFVSCLWLKIPVVALKLLGRGLLPPYLKAPPGGWGRRSRGGSRWETHIKAHFMAVDKPQFLHFMGLSTRLPQGQLPPTSLHTP